MFRKQKDEAIDRGDVGDVCRIYLMEGMLQTVAIVAGLIIVASFFAWLIGAR